MQFGVILPLIGMNQHCMAETAVRMSEFTINHEIQYYFQFHERANDVNPVVFDSPEEISKLGIKLSFLAGIIATITERDLETLTTAQLCENHLKPVTSQYQCSYCEYL